MKKSIIFLSIFIISTIVMNAQNVAQTGKKVKDQKVSSDYDRNSMTFYYLDFNENHSDLVKQKFSSFVVPDKFYDNTLDVKILKVLKDRASITTTSVFAKQINTASLDDVLTENKTGQKLISKWFSRTNGQFGVDLLKERGMYNATDADYVVAQASKRGKAALMDMGMNLVDKSFVLMFDFSNVMTMNEYYEKNKTEAKNRTSNGFMADVTGYLYKLDFNDSVAAVFFQDYWIGENDPNRESKIKAFESTSFPLKLVSTFTQPLSASQFNPGQKLAPKTQKSSDQLMQDLVNSGMNGIITKIENKFDEFRVKAFVTGVRPITSKIGRKEGLKFDQRYFVYENIQTNSGETITKRKGVVKAIKISDNRDITSGETQPSQFYQTSGWKIDNYGMFMEQKNAVGINLFLGLTNTEFTGFAGRAEFYISTLIYEGAVKKGRSGLLSSLHLYIEGGYDTQENLNTEYNFLKLSAGFGKELYPIPNFHIAPFVGYGLEKANWDNAADNKISSQFVEGGVRAGINATYNIQLVGSVNYKFVLFSEEQDKDGTKVMDITYDDTFPDRGGIGYSFGIRFMF
ncbi:MAG: hypothetical protein KKG99_06260 [Bacteroidetes bacterium]|nr:hypothetical protein [Bacteroidota bacterium]